MRQGWGFELSGVVQRQRAGFDLANGGFEDPVAAALAAASGVARGSHVRMGEGGELADQRRVFAGDRAAVEKDIPLGRHLVAEALQL
ncbi:hypothetical protein D3C75_322040 [compost metagenome]